MVLQQTHLLEWSQVEVCPQKVGSLPQNGKYRRPRAREYPMWYVPAHRDDLASVLEYRGGTAIRLHRSRVLERVLSAGRCIRSPTPHGLPNLSYSEENLDPQDTVEKAQYLCHIPAWSTLGTDACCQRDPSENATRLCRLHPGQLLGP